MARFKEHVGRLREQSGNLQGTFGTFYNNTRLPRTAIEAEVTERDDTDLLVQRIFRLPRLFELPLCPHIADLHVPGH
jgi:hypothetical protein